MSFFNTIGNIVTTPLTVVSNAAKTAQTISSIPVTVATGAAKGATTTVDTINKVQSGVANVITSPTTYSAIGKVAGGAVNGIGSVAGDVVNGAAKVVTGVTGGVSDFFSNIKWIIYATLGVSVLGGAIYIVMEARKKER